MHSAPHARAAAKRNSSPIPSIKANYCSSLRRADHSDFDLAPQLIAANSSTHSKGRHAASGPGVVVSGQACRDSFGIQTAILPIMLSDNATPGAPYAAAVRPQPCLASWEPVFAGVTCCGAPVMDASMRVSPGSAVCGAQKERGTLLRCAVGPCPDVLPLALD